MLEYKNPIKYTILLFLGITITLTYIAFRFAQAQPTQSRDRH